MSEWQKELLIYLRRALLLFAKGIEEAIAKGSK
jgi:hypothetical protein